MVHRELLVPLEHQAQVEHLELLVLLELPVYLVHLELLVYLVHLEQVDVQYYLRAER
jgi:hypothetical protein